MFPSAAPARFEAALVKATKRPPLLIAVPLQVARAPPAEAETAPPRDVSRVLTPVALSYRYTSSVPLWSSSPPTSPEEGVTRAIQLPSALIAKFVAELPAVVVAEPGARVTSVREPDTRDQRKTSMVKIVSVWPGTRLVASLKNPTQAPSEEIRGRLESPEGVAEPRLTRLLVPVTRS